MRWLFTHLACSGSFLWCSGLSLTSYMSPFSPFHTCTATLKLSRHYHEELYVRTQMSKSVGPDIKQTFSYQLHVQSLCNVQLSPCVNTAGNFLENSQRASGCVDDFLSCSWHETERADAEIIRQIQRTTRDSVAYDQITNRLNGRMYFCVMSCLLHAIPRRHQIEYFQ